MGRTRFRSLRNAAAVVLALGLVGMLAAGACSPTPAPTPVVSPSPTTRPSPTPTPTALPEPGEVTPEPVPAGSVMVDVPLAGIRLPVPAAWEVVDATALADEATRAALTRRYPGTDRLLDAAEAMGDRATPALIALDPAAEGSDTGIAPNISVLVAQPAVTGPLLDFVAGFVREGFEDAFGTDEPEQERVVTAIGEAIRFRFVIPSESASPLVATTWVVGAKEGTLLISVIGPANDPPASDPDAIIEAAAPLD